MIYVGGFLEPGKDYRTVSLDSMCPFNQPVLGRVDQQDTGLGTPIIYLLVGWRGCLPLLCLALSYLPRGEPITLYPNSHYWRYYYISLVLYLLYKLDREWAENIICYLETLSRDYFFLWPRWSLQPLPEFFWSLPGNEMLPGYFHHNYSLISVIKLLGPVSWS